MPENFEMNIPQLEANLADSAQRITELQNEIQNLQVKLSQTSSAEEKQHLQQLLRTTQGALQYHNNQHKINLKALGR